MGHRLQQFLPAGRIIDLGEFLRQKQVIPADDAILDEPLQASAISFLLRLQEFAWIADRDRAREGVDMLDAAEHLFNGHAQHRLVDHPQIEDQEMAGITQPLHPHLFRHQMLTYLTSKGLTDAQIQLISGHESKKSLEVYQHLSLESVDKAYQDAVQSVGI
jgi:integrase